MIPVNTNRFAAFGVCVVFLTLVGVLGCSSGNGGPVGTSLEVQRATHREGPANRVLWGVWHVTIDADTLTAEVTPLRGAAFTANVTRFMQPPISPTNMVSFSLDPSSNPPEGYFAVDVTLKHPFPGLNYYNGFDVRGILYSDGSIVGNHDPTVLRIGDGDTTLLNADGYTRWWNWTEFTTYETIFGATQGKLAPPYHPTSTVNAYKYFADDLDAEKPMTALNPASRGFFATLPGVNTRQYEIQFKMEGGKTVFDFNYAVDASWAEPDKAFSPDYPPEAFPPSANCQEPFLVNVADAGSTAFYVNESDKGGEFVLDIEVYDWQGGASGDVPGEIAGIWLEGDILGGAVDVLSGATILPGTTVNSSVYEVTIGSLDLTASGDFELFGTVESTDPNTYEPQVPGGSLFDYPDAPLSAYFACTVTVLDHSPSPEPTVTGIDPDEGIPDCTPEHVTVTGSDFVDGATFRLERDGEPDIEADDVIFLDENTLEGDLMLAGAEPGLWDVAVENPGGVTGVLADAFEVLEVMYVDGDNAGDPDMDGSKDHPYDTIQKGIDNGNAAGIYTVIVDQCTVPYDPFTLVSGMHIIGCNWNDGVGWPTVEQNSGHIYGNSVNDVTIEGLFFDVTLSSGSDAIRFNYGDGITLTKCRFSAVVNVLRGYILRFSRSYDVEVSYSEFTEIYQRATETDWRALYVFYGGGTNGVHIHHCEFHDIGYDVPDAGAYGNSLYVIRVGYDGNTPHNVDFHNILAYDIFDKTDCIRPSPNPDPQNALGVFSLGNINSFDWVGDFNLYNITIDNIRHADPPSSTTVNAGHVNGGYFGVCGGTRNWKNNIVSNIEPTDDWVVYGNTSYYGWWVDGYLQPPPSPQPMDYSLVFNVGKPLPPGENWSSGWFYGYCNQVSKGTGSYGNDEDIDPEYDMTPGEDYYHPTNPLISEGGSDGGEMGAFGGPEGDWIPPSQL